MHRRRSRTRRWSGRRALDHDQTGGIKPPACREGTPLGQQPPPSCCTSSVLLQHATSAVYVRSLRMEVRARRRNGATHNTRRGAGDEHVEGRVDKERRASTRTGPPGDEDEDAARQAAPLSLSRISMSSVPREEGGTPGHESISAAACPPARLRGGSTAWQPFHRTGKAAREGRRGGARGCGD